MGWRLQIEALICAVFLFVTVAIVAVKALTPVVASLDSVEFDQPNFSSQTKEPNPPARAFGIDAPWDKGSLWDDEAPAYDLSD